MNSTSPERYAIVPTADGSPTIYDTLFHAHFHSLHGALTESRHVFIRNGLEYFINKFPHISHIRIFEFGFGSGLNAFLTLQKVRDLNNINVTYHAIEKHLLPDSILNAYIKEFEKFFSVKDWANMWVSIKEGKEWESGNLKLKVVCGNGLNKAEGKFHLFYWDAFGPGQHEEAWSEAIITNIKNKILSPGMISTFCAQGKFKRALKSAGFRVENPPGPPGKKEMTVGIC